MNLQRIKIICVVLALLMASDCVVGFFTTAKFSVVFIEEEKTKCIEIDKEDQTNKTFDPLSRCFIYQLSGHYYLSHVQLIPSPYLSLPELPPEVA